LIVIFEFTNQRNWHKKPPILIEGSLE